MSKLVRSIVLTFLFAGVIFGFLFWREVSRIRQVGVQAWTEDMTADCAVVLTGSAGRVREGFDLLARGAVKKLVISGVFPGARLREIFPQLPYYSGLKASDIMLERQSKTTFGNAQQSLPLVEAMGCRDVLLVTTDVHMYRAFKTFLGVYPESILLRPRAVTSGSVPPDKSDVYQEALKSLFYSTWAY